MIPSSLNRCYRLIPDATPIFLSSLSSLNIKFYQNCKEAIINVLWSTQLDKKKNPPQKLIHLSFLLLGSEKIVVIVNLFLIEVCLLSY